jgi:hypothetical protein
VLRRSSVFRISRPFLNKFITASKKEEAQKAEAEKVAAQMQLPEDRRNRIF